MRETRFVQSIVRNIYLDQLLHHKNKYSNIPEPLFTLHQKWAQYQPICSDSYCNVQITQHMAMIQKRFYPMNNIRCIMRLKEYKIYIK